MGSLPGGASLRLEKAHFAALSVLPALLQKLVGEFFLIFRREIWWEIWREFSGIFSDPQNEGLKFSGKTSEHFS